MTKAQTTATNPAMPDEIRYPQESSSLPAFASMTPQQLLQPSLSGILALITPAPFSSTQAPSSSVSPWAHARERPQVPLGTDHHSCATSAGFSNASTPRVHCQPSWDVSSITCFCTHACPAVGTPTYPLQTSQQQPSGSGGRSHQDEVRKDRSPIPKLNVTGGDATS